MKITFFLTTLFFLFTAANELDNNVLYNAAADELNRSIHKLKIKKQVKPYYISYRITDTDIVEIEAAFGGLLYSDVQRNRDAFVDLRVGSYDFDNSNFICQTKSSGIIESDHTNLPLEENYDEIRQSLWIVTDGTYKKALEKLSRKKATLQNQPAKDDIPDFSKVSHFKKIEPLVQLSVDKAEWEKYIVQISKVFQKYPRIHESNVKFYTRVNNKLFLDTEGNRSRTADLLTYIEVSAKAQSEDGDQIEDHVGFYCRTPDELPRIGTISTVVEAMAETLSLQTKLKKEEDYSGPILFIGQAAAELFFQILGKGISDPKSPLFENEMLARSIGSKEMGMLTKKLGHRVMPAFLSAYDDPNITEWQGTPLIGHFSVDDQGVCAERVNVVEDGKLHSILMSRAPTKKISASNGHGRYRNERYGARVCGMVGNLIVKSSESKSKDQLHSMLIEICRDYEIPHGIIVTRLTPTKPLTLRERYINYYTSMTGGTKKSALSSPIVAYKVDAKTGKNELVRGLDFSSVTPRILRDIVATDDSDFIYNFLYRDNNGNEFPMSVVAPAVLVEEIEMVTKETKPKKQPILKHPYF